jgi:phage shock protein C
MPDQTRTRQNLFDVSTTELEHTLNQYMEEEAVPEKPAAGLMNPITLIGLGVLSVCALVAAQFVLPIQGDFTEALTPISIFGGIAALMTGLGWFTRPKKKKKKARPVVLQGDVDEFALSKSKRLTKSATNRRISGVCGGIAAYLGVDASLIRLLFVIFTFITTGSAVLLYVVLAFVLPKEKRKRD